MIKEEELRRKVSFVLFNDVIHYVFSLNHEYVEVRELDKIGITSTSYESINPIPLTSELLNKAGFITSDAEAGYKKYELNGISLQNDGNVEGGNNNLYYLECSNDNKKEEIKYLHQLQHFYLDCTSGKEIEIDL